MTAATEDLKTEDGRRAAHQRYERERAEAAERLAQHDRERAEIARNREAEQASRPSLRDELRAQFDEQLAAVVRRGEVSSEERSTLAQAAARLGISAADVNATIDREAKAAGKSIPPARLDSVVGALHRLSTR